MLLQDLSHIVPTYSFLLGWKSIDKGLRLYFDLILTEQHPLFEPFDRRSIGCYRLTILELIGASKMHGFSPENQLPQWDDKLKEYVDIFEIYEMELAENQFTISDDDWSAHVTFESYRLEMKLDKRFEGEEIN